MGISYLMRPDDNMTFADVFPSMLLAGVFTLIIMLFVVSVVPFIVQTLIPLSLTLISNLFSFLATFIGIVLSPFTGLYKVIKKVIKSPRRLYSFITKSYKSKQFFSEEDLNYIFHHSKNREMYVGDLLEHLADMKKDLPDESLYLEKYNKKLEEIRREILKQIFIIKINSIKTKIENMFSSKKKKIDN